MTTETIVIYGLFNLISGFIIIDYLMHRFVFYKENQRELLELQSQFENYKTRQKAELYSLDIEQQNRLVACSTRITELERLMSELQIQIKMKIRSTNFVEKLQETIVNVNYNFENYKRESLEKIKQIYYYYKTVRHGLHKPEERCDRHSLLEDAIDGVFNYFYNITFDYETQSHILYDRETIWKSVPEYISLSKWDKYKKH